MEINYLLFFNSMLSCKLVNLILEEGNMLQCSDRAFWRPRFLAHCLFSFSYFIMEQKKIKTMISHLFSEIWGGGTFEYENCAQLWSKAVYRTSAVLRNSTIVCVLKKTEVISTLPYCSIFFCGSTRRSIEVNGGARNMGQHQ